MSVGDRQKQISHLSLSYWKIEGQKKTEQQVDIETVQWKEEINFLDLVERYLPELTQQMVAVRVGQMIKDLSTPVPPKDHQSYHLISVNENEGMEILHHTTTHVMAYALKKLHPQLLVTIGPPIEEGFFYDFDQIQLKQEDLVKVEAEMKKIVQTKLINERIEMDRSQALEFFSDNPYKIELIKEIPEDETITCYRMGSFTDLCRGPHLPNTGMIKALKLLRIAGAYWRGKSENKMLTRVYGTSFPDKTLLKNYLTKLETIERVEHNRLGREMGLFTSHEMVGQGLPFLTAKGTTIKNVLQRFVEDEEKKRGYEFTQTPYLSKSDLFKVSGHWSHYKENMFVIEGEETLVLRPMTCPFHFCLYNSERRSYRELPVRYAETSVLFRNESSGEMHGLTRVRQFTLSDGHIVCTRDQLAEEFKNCLQLCEFYLKVLNLKNYWFRFSKWDPLDKENKYVNDPESWDRIQSIMKKILDDLGVYYVEAKGEAAFYGPKLDLQMKNIHGKEDTMITIQLDFALPEKFKMKYIDSNDQEQTPLVIHRSSIGCYERTIAQLIETYEGKFPFWLAPEQVIILSISEEIHDYSRMIQNQLLSHGIRSRLDLRPQSLKKKIREAQLKRIPCLVTLGNKEKTQSTVSVRTLSGKVQMDLSLEFFLNTCKKMDQEKCFENLFD